MVMRYFVLKPFHIPKEWIQARETTLPVEESLGLVLAKSALAETDIPSVSFAKRDGWAVCASDLDLLGTRIPVEGCCKAGDTPTLLVPGTAVRINTGAAIPQGADAVIASLNPADRTAFLAEVAQGENIVPRASDWHKGEEILPAGIRVGVRELALLTEANITHIHAILKPRVTIVATGSEIQAGFHTQCSHIQKHSGNAIYLSALMRRIGIEDTKIVTIRDDKAELAQLLLNEAQHSDLIITIGGTGRGSCDFTRQALNLAGATFIPQPALEEKHQPFVVAKIQNTAILGLPGNPLGVIMITQGALLQVMRKAFLLPETPRRRVQALITEPIEDGVVGDLCVSLYETDGIYQAEPVKKGSGYSYIFSSANGIVKLVGAGIAPGDKVTVSIFDN